MGKVYEKALAGIEFTLRWKSYNASHTDRYCAQKVNFWRDIFPQDLSASLMGKGEGDVIVFHDIAENSLPTFHQGNVFDIEQNQFDREYPASCIIEPHVGRFYPKGILKSLPGIFRGNSEPFRCVGVDDKKITVDFNHPLADKQVELTAMIGEVRSRSGDIGGSCTDWIEQITQGPGMQARWQEQATDFFSDRPFSRPDETDDRVFYNQPRMVTHIDDKAISVISTLYGTLLKKGMKVLDLMSSFTSHIPESLKLDSLTGLGLNEEEMRNNPQLTCTVIHDLNKNTFLPFNDNYFDAVICTVSVEYLLHPQTIFDEVARILKADGYCIVTFSNRWFPPKAIRIWTELHDFERMGLILEYFFRSGRYRNLETFSVRGLPRPENDKYYSQIRVADPVYAVWGHKE